MCPNHEFGGENDTKPSISAQFSMYSSDIVVRYSGLWIPSEMQVSEDPLSSCTTRLQNVDEVGQFVERTEPEKNMDIFIPEYCQVGIKIC